MKTKNILSNLLTKKEINFFSLAATLTLAVMLPATLFAWGPDRATYTIEKPADHVTFNSITNNPNYGDERNFVTIKDATNANAGGWVDELNVENNKEYYVRAYVHNNAADNLNLVANNVTANFNVPTSTAKRVQIDGYISSTNASPTKVWDQAAFTSSTDFKLDYIEGSATYTNNVFTNGTALSDSVTTTGALLGYNQLNGNIPGCFQYSGLVIFKVKAITINFDIQKTVRINGATDKTFKESVVANPGDKVDYQIYFKNNGGTQLTDVIIKDTLPSDIKYISGTTYLFNSTNGSHLVNDGVTTSGINIGGYLPGGEAYIKFTAQVNDSKTLATCGENSLVNTASATTTDGVKSDTAAVLTTKVCAAVTQSSAKVSPKELPHTGVRENIIAFIGVASVTVSAIYYMQSRRKLQHSAMGTQENNDLIEQMPEPEHLNHHNLNHKK